MEFPKVAIPDLRTARELSGAVLSNRPPCDIVGVITYSNPEVGTGFIHDGTGEVFMSSGTNGPLPIKVGNRVRVTGVFENGWFTPIINDATVDVLGVGKLPGPEVLDYEQLFDGEGDARWLRLKAHVLDVQIGDAEAFLNLGCPMGRFSAVLPISALDDQLVRVGAELHLTGVLGTLFDINNRFSSIQLQIPLRSCVEPVESPRVEWESLPVTPIKDILKPHTRSWRWVPLRIRGVVTLGETGGRFFVQDATGGIEVAKSPTAPFPLRQKRDVAVFSEEVEVFGFPSPHQHGAVLDFAQIRPLGPGQQPVPWVVINVENDDQPTSVVVKLRGSYYGDLRQESTVVAVLRTQTNRLVVETRHSERPDGREWWGPVRRGAEVEVTGVLETRATVPGTVVAHTIWLRNPNDIVVLHNGPWLTQSRMKVAATAVGVATVAALLWAFILGRRLEARRRQLVEENQHRLRAEDRAQKLAQDQRAIFDALSEGVLLVGADGSIVTVNPAARQLLFDSDTVPEPLNWRDIPWVPSDSDGVVMNSGKNILEATFATGARSTHRIMVLESARRPRQWLLVNVGPFSFGADGRLDRAVVSISDLNAQHIAHLEQIRARELAEAANLAKTEFLAVVSHEIRTPLSAVVGFSDLLLQEELEPKERRFAETIRDSGEVLISLVNEILDFSKIEAGRLQLDFAVFPLLKTFEEVATLLSAKAESKQIELVMDIDPRVGADWYGDRARIRMVLTNLVGNAIKFTTVGAVQVRVGLDDQNFLRVEVCDSGPGISEEEQKHLFKKFSQIERTLGVAERGSGLGLSIVKQLVELMGGAVGCESRLGQGSTFWFTLKPADGRVWEPAEPSLPSEIGWTRALIVTPSLVTFRALQRRLGGWGFTCQFAATTSEAERLLREAESQRNSMNMVVVDSGFPSAQGYGSFDWLKNAGEQGFPAVIRLCSRQRAVTDTVDEFHAATVWKPVVFPTALRQAIVWTHTRQNPQLAAQVVGGKASGAVPRVLVVEDDRVNAMMAVYLLDRLGCEVRSAISGEEAVSLCRTESFDLVLMDGTLPGMDGMAATRAIREDGVGKSHVPIVAVTGSISPEEERRFRAAGLDGFLAKPLRADELKVTVARWIRLPDRPVVSAD